MERLGGGKRVQVAFVERAARGDAVVLGALAADVKHRGGRLYGGEPPQGKGHSKGGDLRAGSRADAEDIGIGGKLGEYQADKEVQGVALRGELGKQPVVDRRALLVKDNNRFLRHGREDARFRYWACVLRAEGVFLLGDKQCLGGVQRCRGEHGEGQTCLCDGGHSCWYNLRTHVKPNSLRRLFTQATEGTHLACGFPNGGARWACARWP